MRSVLRNARHFSTGSILAMIGGIESKSANIEDNVPRGKFPKVTKRIGASPPQYPDWDDDDWDEQEDE